jgi:DNA-binding beta-propeller fold protein YncE
VTSRTGPAALAAVALATAAVAARADGPPPPLVGLRPDAIVWEHLYDGPFVGPGALFYEPNAKELYVGDRVTNVIGIFTADGIPLFAFGDSRLHEIRGLAVDREGHIHVVDNDVSRVKVYSYRGEFLFYLELTGYRPEKKPDFTAIHFDRGGQLFLGDSANGEVLVVSPSGRVQLRLHGSPTEFSTITGIATDERLIYVADQAGVAIQVFDRVGRFVRGWGEHQAGKQNVSLPHGICVDARGRVVLIDTLRQEIKVFQATGQLVEIFGGLGRAPGQVLYPTAGACDDTGRVYVGDSANNRVQILQAVDGALPPAEPAAPAEPAEPAEPAAPAAPAGGAAPATAE